jgi:hypothetical protein
MVGDKHERLFQLSAFFYLQIAGFKRNTHPWLFRELAGFESAILHPPSACA